MVSGQITGTGDVEINLLAAGTYAVTAQIMTNPVGFGEERATNESVLRTWQPTTQPEPVAQSVVQTNWRQIATVETRDGEITRVEFTLGGTE